MSPETTGPDIASGPSPSSMPRGHTSVTDEAAAAASGLGCSAAREADRARTRAAAGLETAASSVHAGVDRAAGAAHAAGEAISSGAQYVRDHDAREIMEDTMDVVKKNPGISLLGAAAIGFLIGRVLTRG